MGNASPGERRERLFALLLDGTPYLGRFIWDVSSGTPFWLCRPSPSAIGKAVRRPSRLVDRDARLLHDPLPLVQLSLDEGGELLRRARLRLGAVGLEHLAHPFRREGAHDLAVETLDDGIRRPPWREH